MNPDHFSQPQREALINVLALAMYVDSHLSLAEDEALNAFVEGLQWESGRGRTVFVTDAINRVHALGTKTDQNAYLREQARAFDTAEARTAALDRLTAFLRSDGVAETEAPFLAEFRAALAA